MEEKELLETLLVAQVLTLAKTIEIRENSGGSSVSKDFIAAAARLVAQKRPEVLRLLLETPPSLR